MNKKQRLLRPSKSLYNLTFEGIRININCRINTTTNHIGIYTQFNKPKDKIPRKLLYYETIDNCNIGVDCA